MLLFLRPDVMIALWAWHLAPLTAKVVGGMLALAALTSQAMHTAQRVRRFPVLISTLFTGPITAPSTPAHPGRSAKTRRMPCRHIDAIGFIATYLRLHVWF